MKKTNHTEVEIASKHGVHQVHSRFGGLILCVHKHWRFTVLAALIGVGMIFKPDWVFEPLLIGLAANAFK